jgi:uncharacterized phage infection (PIP) family protein YhgE
MFVLRGYAYTEDDSFLENGRKIIGQIKTAITSAKDLAREHSFLTQLQTSSTVAEENLTEYERLLNQSVEKINQIKEERKVLVEQGKQYRSAAQNFLKEQHEDLKQEIKDSNSVEIINHVTKIRLITEVLDAGNEVRVAFYIAESQRKPELIRNALPELDKVISTLQHLKKLADTPEQLADLDRIQNASELYRSTMLSIVTHREELQEITTKRLVASDAMLKAARELAEGGLNETSALSKQSVSDLSNASRVVVLGLIIGAIVGLSIGTWVAIAISSHIKEVASALNAGAMQTASAANQVSNASQQLAQGAAEQAASLEETAASLEEISSMPNKTRLTQMKHKPSPVKSSRFPSAV